MCLRSSISLSFSPLSATVRGLIVCTSEMSTSLILPELSKSKISLVTNSLLFSADLLLLKKAGSGSFVKGRA